MKSFFSTLAVLLPFFLNAQSECAPNNSFGQACEIQLIDLMGSINGSINPVNDADYFYFEIPRSGVITYRVTNVPSNIAMVAALIPDYDQSQAISSASGGNGQSIEGIKKVCPAGKYYVKLYDNFSNPDQSPDLYTLKVTLDTSDVHECNDNFTPCTQINLNTEVHGAINSTNDVDFYCFNIPRSGVITYRVTNVPSNIAMVAALIPDYDQSQAISSASGGNGQSIEGIKKVCPAGKYYVKLYDNFSNPDQSPDLYTLKVTLDTSDVYECNDDFLTASMVNCNSPVFASINTADDKDCFKITLTQPDIITVNVTNVPANLDLTVTLVGPAPSNIELQKVNGATGASVTLVSPTTLQPGTYYVCITDNKANTAQYQLNINCPSVVGTDENQLSESISIYPNPTNEVLYLDVVSNFQPNEYKIRNLLGELILYNQISSQKEAIDVSRLSSGLYLIEVRGPEGRISRQFIKL